MHFPLVNHEGESEMLYLVHLHYFFIVVNTYNIKFTILTTFKCIALWH